MIGSIDALDLIRRSNPCDDYEILQRVGSGTYGEVYKARDTRTGELAAVKEVKLQPNDNFALIQQEIVMLRDCSNSNIIAYYGSYLRNDRLWIVCEYCAGGSLQDIYHMTGALSELQIAFVCRETLRGLNYLHMMNKIHRDVKGANILLTNQGDVKLADFGVAAQITMTIAKRKSFIGTPYWMAPEVAAVETKGGYNQLCDVWAVGITAIELAETQPPFFDMHPMRLLALMTKSSYKVPSLKDKIKWSPYFHDFIKQCLIKNPKKRPTPERLLHGSRFVQGALSSRLTRDLLDRVNNASTSRPVINDEDASTSSGGDEVTSNVPRRIPSRAPADLPAGNRPIRPMSAAHNLEDTTASTEMWRHLHDDQQPWVASPLYKPSARILCDSSNTPGQYSTQRTMPGSPPDLLVGHETLTRNTADTDATLTRDTNGPHLGTPDASSSDDETNANYQHSMPVAPQRRPSDKKTATTDNADSQCFGLPPTPKVTMGACFSKIFHGCPLRLNCSTSWVQKETKDQYILLGAEEGIYAINLNQLHEATMIRIHPRRCTWMYMVFDVLYAVQGNTPHVYRHDIQALFHRDLTRKISLTINKVPEKFMPRKLAITTRIPETKNCLRCCVQRNPFNGYLYLCALVPTGVVLMQWYEPLQKFMIIKEHTYKITLPCRIFELLMTTKHDYPIVCTGVRRVNRKQFHLDLIDLNKSTTEEVALPSSNDNEDVHAINATAVRQIAREILVVCVESRIYITNLQGRVKCWQLPLQPSSTPVDLNTTPPSTTDDPESNETSAITSQPAQLTFPFRIEHIVCLSDSVLAVHRHGVQGRSLVDGQLTQELQAPSHVYRMLGSDKAVVFESRPVQGVLHASGTGTDLVVLTGHESTLAPV